jgi:hypothetical protein
VGLRSFEPHADDRFYQLLAIFVAPVANSAIPPDNARRVRGVIFAADSRWQAELGTEDAETPWKSGRLAGAPRLAGPPWTFAIEPGAGRTTN